MKKLFIYIILSFLLLQATGQQITIVKVPPSKDTSVIRFSTTTTATTQTLTTYSINSVPGPIDTVTPPGPVTPGKYEGFGSQTKGGANGQTVRVTNLNASGAGSLKDAIKSNRNIVFDVSGTINGFRYDGNGLANVTIDGNGKNITLNGNAGSIIELYNCHDIIITNIRFRGKPGYDDITIIHNSYNIVIDHVSVAGAGDGGIDVTDGSHDVTIQYCILGNSTAGASLVAYPGTKNVSIHHSLYSSFERNPFIHNATNYQPNNTEEIMCDFSNNIVWNFTNFGSCADYGGTLQARNNLYQKNDKAIVINRESSGGKVFASGNVSANGGNPNTVSNHNVWNVAPVTMQTACQAAAIVKASAGCRPLDKFDNDLINSISLTGCN